MVCTVQHRFPRSEMNVDGGDAGWRSARKAPKHNVHRLDIAMTAWELAATGATLQQLSIVRAGNYVSRSLAEIPNSRLGPATVFGSTNLVAVGQVLFNRASYSHESVGSGL